MDLFGCDIELIIDFVGAGDALCPLDDISLFHFATHWSAQRYPAFATLRPDRGGSPGSPLRTGETRRSRMLLP
jgi:hypothetical protein